MERVALNARRNKGGRPKTVHEVVMLARQHGPAAIRKLYELMTTAPNPATQLAAACALLDRGFGKPFMGIAIGELPRSDVQIDPSMSPVEAAAQWAAMIGANDRQRNPRLIEHDPLPPALTENNLAARLKAVLESSD